MLSHFPDMSSFIGGVRFKIPDLSYGIVRMLKIKVLLGGYSGEVPPLPIPNREVKLTNADGTALIVWESR